jgi:hypothetical protein
LIHPVNFEAGRQARFATSIWRMGAGWLRLTNARRDIPETPAEPHFGQLADGANVRSIPDTYAAARTVVSPSRNSSIFGSVGCTCATVSSDIPDFRASGSLSGTFHSIGRSQRWLQRARSIGADVRSINGANVSSIPAVHRLSQTPPHLRPMSFFLGGDFFVSAEGLEPSTP